MQRWNAGPIIILRPRTPSWGQDARRTSRFFYVCKEREKKMRNSDEKKGSERGRARETSDECRGRGMSKLAESFAIAGP